MKKNFLALFLALCLLLPTGVLLTGCGRAEPSQDTLSVQLDDEDVPVLLYSRFYTETNDLWWRIPIYSELEDAAPTVAPGEHRVTIDCSACGFPDIIDAGGYRGGGADEDGFEVTYGGLDINSCRKSEDLFSMRFTAAEPAYADEMIIVSFTMKWKSIRGIQDVMLFVGCFVEA